MTNTNRTARVALSVTLASGRTYYVTKAGKLSADPLYAHGFDARDNVKAMVEGFSSAGTVAVIPC